MQTIEELERRVLMLSEAFETLDALDRAKGVTAAAPRGTPSSSMARRMAAASPRATRPVATGPSTAVAVHAGVTAGPVVAGQPFTGAEQMAEATADVLRTMEPGRSPEPRRQVVARARWDLPEDRQLGDDAVSNTQKIEAVCGQNAPRYDQSGALVATGGICLPVNVDYAVPTWSTADRPLRDGLPAFQATRGGVRYVTPPDVGVPSLQGTASGAGTSVTIWTEATDAAPAGQSKPVWTVACGQENLVYVNAVPTRVQFGNMQSRFAPEQIAANTQQAIAISAREAELELLTNLAASTKQVAPAQFLGAVRDVLPTVDLTTAQYLYSHRFSPNTALTAIFPAWARHLFRADLAREMAHDNAGSVNALAITDAQIDDWFAARNVNVIWTLDALAAGTYGTGSSAITDQFFPVLTGAAAEPAWPGSTDDAAFMLVWFLFVEGTFQLLDGGRLDLGVVRDSLLDATNDYETFVEVFENVAFRGIDAYQVQQTVLPTGLSSGWVSSGYDE